MKKRQSSGARMENSILTELEKGLKDIYGSELRKIILYGSYARGDHTKGSDLDVMVLLDMGEERIKKCSENVLDLSVDLTTRYGVVVSIQEHNIDFFNNWVDTLPFFNNVSREGVELYGR
jgi:predicted nucleotidyltransferase